MPPVSLSEWNQFIQDLPHCHFLQTGEWGELKSAFGWKPLRLIAGGDGVQILFRSLPLGLTFAYLPKPYKFEDGELLAEIDKVCRANKAIFLKIEQDEWETDSASIGHGKAQKGFIVSPHSIQPRRTIVLDIRGTEEEILGSMKQKCRYNIRLAEKKEVVVKKWDDIEGFYQLMKSTGGRDGFSVHSEEYYKRVYSLFQPAGLAELLMAEYNGKPLAAIMVFSHGRRSWYVYGASTDDERNRMPAYLLQWEAIRWARSKGAEEYDLWGIPDEEEDILEAQFETRHDGLWGVYRFKRGFGGETRRAVPAMDKIFNPIFYQLYRWRMAGRETG